MNEYVKPMDIERRSFEIIRSELGRNLDPELEPVILRVIHATADLGFADTLNFTPGVVQKIREAFFKGASVVTDTNMVKAGIHRKTLEKFGGEVLCFMSDDDVAMEAERQKTTRAAISMEKAASLGRPFIYAIGNAPTALLSLHRLMMEKKVSPIAIIAVPVGFVNVVEAKELILGDPVPSITACGRKGGSNVAAAICNAVLYMADGSRQEK